MSGVEFVYSKSNVWECTGNPCIKVEFRTTPVLELYEYDQASWLFTLDELEEIVAFMKQKQGQLKALDEMTRQAQELGLYD